MLSVNDKQITLLTLQLLFSLIKWWKLKLFEKKIKLDELIITIEIKNNETFWMILEKNK